MIIVRNTKELEEQYDLTSIPDDEQIRVIGGMEGKSKYSDERYAIRTTYSASQLKQVIHQMKSIEENIPADWNKWQRAKYIYDVLANNIEYNYDSSTYFNQQSSNLTVLMHGKGICAGYALTFKEMMDRQGIECDYIRGVANGNRPNPERHAWNVLNIDGVQFPIDLTWDSGNKQQGLSQLKYFGNNKVFFQNHVQDSDEKEYNYSLLSNEFVESIDISEERKKEELSTEEKRNILNSAIEQTYKKFESVYGEQQASLSVSEAIKKYINEGNSLGFTRQENARANIEKFINKQNMIELLVEQYVEQCSNNPSISEDILGKSLRENLFKYGSEQAKAALKDYILTGNTQGFTRRK